MTTTLTATASGQRVILRAETTLPDTPITIRRTMGGTTGIVRDADTVIGGAVIVSDYEVLYNTPLSYTATAGAETATATATITETRAWLRSVLRPELSIPVWITEHAESSRTTRTVLLRPVGRRNPVAITDIREGQSGASVLVTWDDPGRAGMLGLIADGGVLLLTGPADWRLGPLYLVPLGVSETRPGNLADTPIRRWAVEWAEVDPPPGTLAVAKRSWTDVLALGTWADVEPYTWLGVLYTDGVPSP
ncbi:MAG: hypothetical protein WCF04_05910 [Candidatus Nanopelagicales bacterium]